MTPTEQALKDIHNEITEIIASYNIDFENLDDGYDFDKKLQDKITESYNLGRDEVIEEIEKILEELTESALLSTDLDCHEYEQESIIRNDIFLQNKLTQLKEQKT